MTKDDERADRQVDQLLARLPQSRAPAVDLWPGISAAVAASSVWARVPPTVEPDEDLWPAIEAKIEHGRGSGSDGRHTINRRVLAVAACLAVLAIAGLSLFEIADTGDAARGEAGPALANVEQPGGQLSQDPDFFFPAPISAEGNDARATFRENIALVRAERMLIEESLEQYPTDPRLRELWRHAYETELRLVDTAGRVLSTI